MSLTRILLAIALCVLGSTHAYAQRLGPVHPVVPQAPVAVAPLGTVLGYDYNAPRLAFVWDQAPALGSPAAPLPTQFVFCLRRANDPPCSRTSALFTMLPGALASVPRRAPGSWVPVAYRYTFVPTLPDDRLDQPVAWQVGACTGSTEASCRYSAATWIVAATQDLQAIKTDGTDRGTEFDIDGVARNLGSRDSALFDMRIEAWDVLIDETNETCLNNPNDAALRAETTLYAIDSRGRATQFANLPLDAAGNYVAPDVIAIYRPNSTFGWYSTVIPDKSLEATAGVVPPPRTSFGYLTIATPEDTRPRGFAAKLTLDINGELIEPDETNNTVANCLYLD